MAQTSSGDFSDVRSTVNLSNFQTDNSTLILTSFTTILDTSTMHIPTTSLPFLTTSLVTNCSSEAPSAYSAITFASVSTTTQPLASQTNVDHPNISTVISPSYSTAFPTIQISATSTQTITFSEGSVTPNMFSTQVTSTNFSLDSSDEVLNLALSSVYTPESTTMFAMNSTSQSATSIMTSSNLITSSIYGTIPSDGAFISSFSNTDVDVASSLIVSSTFAPVLTDSESEEMSTEIKMISNSFSINTDSLNGSDMYVTTSPSILSATHTVSTTDNMIRSSTGQIIPAVTQTSTHEASSVERLPSPTSVIKSDIITLSSEYLSSSSVSAEDLHSLSSLTSTHEVSSFEILPPPTSVIKSDITTHASEYLSSSSVSAEDLHSLSYLTNSLSSGVRSSALDVTGIYSSFNPASLSTTLYDTIISLADHTSKTEPISRSLTSHQSSPPTFSRTSAILPSTEDVAVTKMVFHTSTPVLTESSSTISSFTVESSTCLLASVSTPTTYSLQSTWMESTSFTSSLYSSSVSFHQIIPSRTISILESSQVTTLPKTTHKLRFIFEFIGDCDRLKFNAKLQIEFWQALIAVISIETSTTLPKGNVQAEYIDCDPFKVMLILKGLNQDEYCKILNGNISVSTFGVPILDEMTVIEYEVKSLKIIDMKNDDDYKRGSSSKTKLEKVDIIIIVLAGILFGFLICMCVAIACRECYKKKRAASFTLLDVPHVSLNMEDFTLTKIPRPKTIYSEGNGVEPTFALANNSRYERPKSLPTCNTYSPFNNETHLINAETIRMRIQPHPEGVLVGLTCTPPRSPTRESPSTESSPRSLASDPSKQMLIKNKHSECGTANPNFEPDEELSSADKHKYIIQEDEKEEFL